MKYILTLTDAKDVKAGVEVFNEYLKKVFPGTKILHCGGLAESFPLFKEPNLAKKLDKKFLGNLQTYRPELVFTNGMYGWALTPEKVNCPIINIQHGTYAGFADNAMKLSLNYFRTRYVYSRYERKGAQRATVVVANSAFTKQNLEKYYGVKDARVINQCIDMDVFKPMNKIIARKNLSLPQDKKICLFVGRPDYTKGFDVVVSLAEKHKGIDFVCVMNPVIEPPTKNMVIRGSVSHEKLKEYYCASDFVIFPSRFEGFGYVPLEALACNTPVIANAVGVVPEIKVEGCLKVENNSLTIFSERIREIPEKINSRQYVEKNFSFELFAKKYKELVKIVL